MDNPSLPAPSSPDPSPAAVPAQTVVHHHPPAPRSHWPWAFAIIVLAVLGGGLLIAWKIVDTAGRVAEQPGKLFAAAAEALRPTTIQQTYVTSAVGALNKEGKLIVLTPTLNVRIEKSKEDRILWGKVYLGTTRVTVEAPENKVQFYVPLDGIRTDNIAFDPAASTLRVRVPRPVLDEQVVDVQSDPSRIRVHTEVGWASLDRMDGQFLRDQARRDLRLQTIVSAKKNQMLREKAEAMTKEKVMQLLRQVMPAEVALDVELMARE